MKKYKEPEISFISLNQRKMLQIHVGHMQVMTKESHIIIM